MGKGGKLKEMLSHQKNQESLDKMEKSKKEKRKANLEKDQPTVVTKDDLATAEQAKSEPKAKEENGEEKSEDYQSQSLSKKDKRKLKKQMKKEPKEEPVKESEDAKESEDDKDEEEDEEEGEKHLDLERLAQSESDEDDEDEDEDEEEDENQDGAEEPNEQEEKEEDVPLSDVEFDSDADVVPHQKLTTNNTKALRQSLQRIQLPWSKHSFEEHVSVTSKTNTDEGIKDIYDDTERELAFYKQSLDGVNLAREQLKKLKIPFQRPLDYFAEMVKSDEHMDKIKGKLVTEASEKKARQDARRQRDLKKFGKQVQNATLQKRQLEKKDTLDKIKALKRKRKHNEIGEDEFNVGVEEATSEAVRPKRQKTNYKREAKDKKYGQGGMKRFKRKNDASSSAEMGGFSHRKMKGRPGKSRRQKKF